MTTLDLGVLLAHAGIEDVQFQRTYVKLVGQFRTLGGEAEKASAGTDTLDESLAATAAAGNTASTSLTRTVMALREAGLSASTANGETSRLALAQSRLAQTSLRAAAAQGRLEKLQESGKATAGQLASAEASLIAANDRLAVSQERVDEAQALGAKTSDALAMSWSKIPPVVRNTALALIVAAGAAVHFASEYQKLTVNLVTGANEQQKNIGMVSRGMLQMAGEVGDSAFALAKAMFTVESAGFHGAAGLTLLKTAAEGAKVDNADLTSVVDVLTSAMKSYHEPASNAARVTNTLIASAAVGKMHLQDLATSMGNVVPIAASLHIPLAQVGAAIATMTARGTDVAKATTGIRFMLASLAAPAGPAIKAMDEVGLSVERVQQTLTHQGLPAALQLITDAIGRKFPAGSARYVGALKAITGGTRGWVAATELTGRNLVDLDKNLSDVNARVAGAGNKVSDWAEVSKNFNVELSRTVDGLEAEGIAIGEHLLPAATAMLHILNDVIHATEDVTHFVGDHKTVEIALAAVIGATVVPALGRMLAETRLIAPALGAMKTAMAAINEQGVASSLMTLVKNLDPVKLALTAAAAAAYLLYRGSKQAFNEGKQDSENFLKAINDTHTSLATSAADTARLQTHVQMLADTLGKGDIDKNIGKISVSLQALRQSQSALKTMQSNVDTLSTALGISKSRVQALAAANRIDLSKPYADVSQAILATLTPTQQLTHDNTILKTAVQGSAQAVDALTQKLDILIGGPLAEHADALAFAQGLDAIRKAAHKNTGEINDNTKAGQANAQLLQSQASNIQQSVSDWEKNGKSIGFVHDHLRALERQTIDAMAATTGNRKAVIAYMRSLNLTPGQIDKVLGSLGRLKSGMDGLKGRAHSDGVGTAEALIQGLANGLNLDSGIALSAAKELGAAVARNVHAGAGAGSPSKLTRYTGQMLGKGLELGLMDGLPAVLQTAKHVGLVTAATIQAATATVFKGIAAAVAPDITDPSTLATIFGHRTHRAIDLQAGANVSRAHANELAEHADHLAAKLAQLRKATADASSAATIHAASVKKESEAQSKAATKMRAENAQNVRDLEKTSAAASKAAEHAKQVASKAEAAAKTAGQAAATAATNLVQQMQTSLDAMTSQIDTFESGISQGLTGDASISTVWQTLTDDGDATVKNLQTNLDDIKASAQNFKNDLDQLAHEGAGQSLISQLAGMGPDGDKIAQQLLAAGPGAIGLLSSTVDGIQSVATQAGDQLAKTFYGAGVDSMEKFIDGLMRKFPELHKALRPLLHTLRGLFTDSGSSTTVPGFAHGVNNFRGGWATVGENGPELVRLPGGSSVYPHGSDGAALGFDLTPVVARLERIEAAVLGDGDRVATAVQPVIMAGAERHAGRVQTISRKQ